MATIEQLKQLFKTDSDEQAILAASKRYGIAPEDIASEVGFNTGGKWGNRASAAVDSYQGNLYGVAEGLTGADWARRGREQNQAAADLSSQFAKSQGAVDSFKDVRGVGDAADYVGGLAVQSAPYMAEAAVGGLVGRGLALGARAAAPLVRAAGVGGAVAAGYPSAAGDIMSNQREQAGMVNVPGALGLAVPYAALNAMGVEGALARGGLTRNAVRALDEARGMKGFVGRGVVSAVRTGAEEGVSEVGQEAFNQLGRMSVDPNETFLNDRSGPRFAESFVGGAALGGVFGGAGGWRRGSLGSEQAPKPTVEEQPDLLKFGGDWTAPAGPQMPPEVAGDRMAGGFNPGFTEYRPPDGVDFTREVNTDGLSLAVDERPQTFALGASFPAQQGGEAAPGTVAQGADPNQLNLFYPNGQPTYAADPTFSGSEPAPPPAPLQLPYNPIPGVPRVTPTGQVVLPQDTAGFEQRRFQQQYAPQLARPDFNLEPVDPSQVTGPFPQEQAPAEPTAPNQFPARNEMRANQRGFVADLPFAPPEAKIATPLGQRLYTTAESLAKEGFLDQGTLGQLVTMLTQNKLGAAGKVINDALAARQQAVKPLETIAKEQIDAQKKAAEEQARAQEEAQRAQEKAAEDQRKQLVEQGKALATQPTTPEGKTAEQLFEEIGRLVNERGTLLRKDGRRPPIGTEKRNRWNALTTQIHDLKAEWALLDQAEKKAKAGAPADKGKPKPASDSAPQADEARRSKWTRLLECLRT